MTLKTDYLGSLVSFIVGQQLSPKAAQTILNRLLSLCNELMPNCIQQTTYEQILLCGISKQKARHLKNLSHSVLTGEVVLSDLDALEDEQFIQKLTKIKGIGRWTAEMFLIFSLDRRDVFSQGDTGLQRAIKWFYVKPVDPSRVSLISDKWRPFRSIASLYLWEAINNGYVDSSSYCKVLGLALNTITE